MTALVFYMGWCNLMKLKDKQIEILAVRNVPTENGFYTETLISTGALVWAYFRHLSGKEIYVASAHTVIEEVLFTINWCAGLNTTYVIRSNGALYDITRVDTFKGHREYLTIYVKRRK